MNNVMQQLEFKHFADIVGRQFKSMSNSTLYTVDVDKDLLWQTYLGAFPAGTNPIYKARTEYDCSCCRSFIKTVGSVVAIDDGRLVTIWDDPPPALEDAYQTVCRAMHELVVSCPVSNLFLHTERTAGTAHSRQLLEDSTVKVWNHFFANLPPAVITPGINIGPRLSAARSTHDVMLRSLTEIPLDVIDSVLDLISQNSLYRGEENKFAVETFRKLKVEFDAIADPDLFVWGKINTPESVARIRNTAIGTLLVDIAEGKEIDDAVKSFEAKVAPTNYKRPTALVTKAMIAKAQAKIDELGFGSALERRYATISDITVNNILFADRNARKEMNVFEQIAQAIPESAKRLDKIDDISIDDFISNVLPRTESVEVLVENRHTPNFVSLIAPVDPTARSMFKWPNNFSWTYNGDVADSIKERVKQAGGRIEADLRCSLSWSNFDDLDLHLGEPDGTVIYFSNKLSRRTNGQLDVDMNAGRGTTRTPVENIFYPDRRKMLEGLYQLRVHNFCRRETTDVGFEAEIEFGGEVHSFSHPQAVPDKQSVVVATFNYTHKDGMKIIESLPSTQATKTIWGISTQNFHRAGVVMLSPNHWDEHANGNRHYFFMLDGCKNEGRARGFYNEFLNADLNEHRKVLEIVGAKMRTEESDRQLSGLGFSSTQRNTVTVKVTGKITRTLKVVF